eukprot:jgi/Chlat1/2882/Chrsp2S04627
MAAAAGCGAVLPPPASSSFRGSAGASSALASVSPAAALASTSVARISCSCTAAAATSSTPVARSSRVRVLSSAFQGARVVPAAASRRASPRSSRRRGALCMSGPPQMAAVTDVMPRQLTKDDLVQYLAAGCKAKSTFRIGTEHEKFGFRRQDGSRMTYEDVSFILNSIAESEGHSRIMENGKYVIGLEWQSPDAPGKANVSLEPGGQFELSGAPLKTLHETSYEVRQHVELVTQAADQIGVSFLGVGFDPKSTREQVPIMPKGRYKIMKEYMPKVGSMGLDMMFRTCTIQVNLDFESEADMVKKMRVGLALQPIATALFAASPFKEGKPTGLLSYRSHVWTDVDNNRCGDLPFVFEDGFGFERYVEYALDVPMYFVYRHGTYIDATGHSFRDFLDGKLSLMPGEYATTYDWEAHLTTIFPEVRLKKFLEMRGADGGPLHRIISLPALWVGLCYDDVVLQQAADMVADWTREERAYLRATVPVQGLKTPFRNGTVQDLAKKVVQLSKEGLVSRGFGEEKYLGEIETIANTGETLAERLLQKYNHDWGHNIDKIYQDEDVLF